MKKVKSKTSYFKKAILRAKPYLSQNETMLSTQNETIFLNIPLISSKN